MAFSNVGNKVAVFVLQSLGFDVAALNTVQFSELARNVRGDYGHEAMLTHFCVSLLQVITRATDNGQERGPRHRRLPISTTV